MRLVSIKQYYNKYYNKIKVITQFSVNTNILDQGLSLTFNVRLQFVKCVK